MKTPANWTWTPGLQIKLGGQELDRMDVHRLLASIGVSKVKEYIVKTCCIFQGNQDGSLAIGHTAVLQFFFSDGPAIGAVCPDLDQPLVVVRKK